MIVGGRRLQPVGGGVQVVARDAHAVEIVELELTPRAFDLAGGREEHLSTHAEPDAPLVHLGPPAGTGAPCTRRATFTAWSPRRS
jgi:hypothetical protein